MSENFYRAMHRTGESIKAVWDVVSGNRFLLDRNIWPASPECKLGLFAGGAAAGLVIGVGFQEALNMNPSVILAFIAAGATLPLTAHWPYALYAAGERDAKRRALAKEERPLLEAPKAALPAPLI